MKIEVGTENFITHDSLKFIISKKDNNYNLIYGFGLNGHFYVVSSNHKTDIMY